MTISTIFYLHFPFPKAFEREHIGIAEVGLFLWARPSSYSPTNHSEWVYSYMSVM